MTVHDREGFELTGATAEARDRFERALDLQHCYLGDPLEAMDRAIVAAPGFAMAHIAHGWMNLIGTEPQGFERARESHNRAVGLASGPISRPWASSRPATFMTRRQRCSGCRSTIRAICWRCRSAITSIFSWAMRA